MKAQLLSLNVGVPRTLEWQGRSIETSMLKSPVSVLEVGKLRISGDQFINTNHHGTPDAVLYAYGTDALTEYSHLLGRENEFAPGDLGENITLDRLDERAVSVGDIFKIGTVIAQATFPRIPCSKINARVQDALGMKKMIEAGRSGIYFRIVQPGQITLDDSFERIDEAPVKFTIHEVYARMVGGVKVTADDVERVRSNGAFPLDRISKKWLS